MAELRSHTSYALHFKNTSSLDYFLNSPDLQMKTDIRILRYPLSIYAFNCFEHP